MAKKKKQHRMEEAWMKDARLYQSIRKVDNCRTESREHTPKSVYKREKWNIKNEDYDE